MKTICLIIPYFGSFKAYFQAFLNSCKTNSTIDWLIYTDNEEEYRWPENVKKINISFEKFKKRINDLFDFEIELSESYKLCDYKPAYGEVLFDDIKDYDFWGFCDCDLIWGDIRKFVTEDILEKNDRIFTRGHLSIFRNNPETNSYYRRQSIISYKDVFMNAGVFAFDEWGGTSKAWEEDNKHYYDELVMDDIIIGLDGFRPTKCLTGLGSPYHKKNTDMSDRYLKMNCVIYVFKNGKLFRRWIENKQIKCEEICYVHFQKRGLRVLVDLDANTNFIIANDSIINYRDIDSVMKHKEIAGKDFSFHNLFIYLKRVVWVNYKRFHG